MKQNMVLLHGLFGQLSNWDGVAAAFAEEYNVHIPALPIYDTPKQDPLYFLMAYVEKFIEERQLKDIVLIGNSLGGHVAILYAALHGYNVKHLVLTGSSGLYENTMLGSYPKRSSVDYIKERVEYTFHDPNIATGELVSQVLSITTDMAKCLGVLRVAKSTQRHYVADLLTNIKAPTLLIWGKEDRITPINVALEFESLLPGAKLVVLNDCGHAPMMEKPVEFNVVLQAYLIEHSTK